MCGLAGQVSLHPDTDCADPLASMFDALRCRGPDAHGRWHGATGAIGHSRLIVRDPLRGHQPHLTTITGREHVIVFGGEIYNSTALHKELTEGGDHLAEASEVGVIARAYGRWGEAFCEHLVGMFAVAIWCPGERRLTLARDRLGIKPLYFARVDRLALFASEPKSILAHPSCRRRVSTEGLNELLAFNLGLPGCGWDDVEEVPPGGLVVLDPACTQRRRYWQLCPTPSSSTDEATELRDLWSTVVQDHLTSDVPIGVLLSGGLDSTSIAATVAHGGATSRLVRTFSMSLEGNEFVADFERERPDDEYAVLAARLLETDHVVVELSADDIDQPHRRAAVVGAYDMPPGSGDRDRTMAALFAEIKRDRSVVLSGEGADELFDGYSWCHDERHLSSSLLPWVSACQGKYGVAPEMLVPAVWAKLDFDDYLHERCHAARRRLPALPARREEHRRAVESRYHHLTELLPVLLARKDRLSMLSGLEVRVPYCDHRLVELISGRAPDPVHRAGDGSGSSGMRWPASCPIPSGCDRRARTRQRTAERTNGRWRSSVASWPTAVPRRSSSCCPRAGSSTPPLRSMQGTPPTRSAWNGHSTAPPGSSGTARSSTSEPSEPWMTPMQITPPDPPLVSIVIPVHNRPDLVVDAVQSCLSQSYERVEVIAVDDGSTDSTGAVLDRFAPDVRVMHVAHGGVSTARNRGLAVARGELVQFLDSDDVLLPSSISDRVALFALFPHAGVVYGRALVPHTTSELPSEVDRTESARSLSQIGRISPDTLWGSDFGIPMSTTSPVLYRRAVVRDAGGFDPALSVHENLELHFRLYLAGVSFVSYSGITGIYRTGRTRSRLSDAERWDHPDLFPRSRRWSRTSSRHGCRRTRSRTSSAGRSPRRRRCASNGRRSSWPGATRRSRRASGPLSRAAHVRDRRRAARRRAGDRRPAHRTLALVEPRPPPLEVLDPAVEQAEVSVRPGTHVEPVRPADPARRPQCVPPAADQRSVEDELEEAVDGVQERHLEGNAGHDRSRSARDGDPLPADEDGGREGAVSLDVDRERQVALDHHAPCGQPVETGTDEDEVAAIAAELTRRGDVDAVDRLRERRPVRRRRSIGQHPVAVVPTPRQISAPGVAIAVAQHKAERGEIAHQRHQAYTARCVSRGRSVALHHPAPRSGRRVGPAWRRPRWHGSIRRARRAPGPSRSRRRAATLVPPPR